jgi:adenylyltransferase/sulfurtransferase
LRLVDHDCVEASNLQRQIAHSEERIGLNKALSAAAAIRALAPGCRVEAETMALDEKSADRLIAGADVVLDCTDNFAARFLINRFCVAHRKPLVSGAAIRLEGQISVFDTRRVESPCYHCLYQESGQEDMTCAVNGVMAPVVGIVGSIQAMEAVKLLIPVGETLIGRLQLLDAQTMEWRTIKLQRDPACTVCSPR